MLNEVQKENISSSIRTLGRIHDRFKETVAEFSAGRGWKYLDQKKSEPPLSFLDLESDDIMGIARSLGNYILEYRTDINKLYYMDLDVQIRNLNGYGFSISKLVNALERGEEKNYAKLLRDLESNILTIKNYLESKIHLL